MLQKKIVTCVYIFYTYDIICEISQNFYTFILDFQLLYCTPNDGRMTETFGLHLINEYRMDRTKDMVLFVLSL
jgi:hypothetical protein